MVNMDEKDKSEAKSPVLVVGLLFKPSFDELTILR